MPELKQCPQCGRPIVWPIPPDTKPYQVHGQIEFCYVVHTGYGCDTGCCGHEVYGGNNHDDDVCHHFEFCHPSDENHMQFARDLAGQNFPGIPLDEARCEILDD